MKKVDLTRLSALILSLLACSCSGSGNDPDVSVEVDALSDASAEDVDSHGKVDDTVGDSVHNVEVQDSFDIQSDVWIDTSRPVDDFILNAQPTPTVEWPDGVRLTVVTYNIFDGKFGSAQAIGQALATLDADLVGLQECPHEFGQEVASSAGFGHIYGDGTVLLSRSELTDPSTVALTTGRAFVHATALIDGRQFSVYNVHLGWNVEGNLQFREFKDAHLVNDSSKYVIIVGDFNDEHYSTQNTILEEWGTDVFTAAQMYPGERISWPSYGFDDTEGSQLIDLIWFRKDNPMLVVDAGPVNLLPPLSDHKPVVAHLLAPPEGVTFGEDPLAPFRDPFVGFPPVDQMPANLLTNPGAEDGLDGWTADGAARAEQTREHQMPRTGKNMFTGFLKAGGADERWSSAYQDVSLDNYLQAIDKGAASMLVSGWLATGYQIEEKDGEVSNVPKPYDTGELAVEMRDSHGAILRRWSSGQRDTLGWHPAAARLVVPAGTRSARLIWMSHHKEANGPSNDAVFDDLYLGVLEDASQTTVTGADLAVWSSMDDPETAPTAAGWYLVSDLNMGGPWGIYPFPPWAYAGKTHFVASIRDFAGATLPAGNYPLCTDLRITKSGRCPVGHDSVLNWGGWLRTWSGSVTAYMSLELLQPDGSLAYEFESKVVGDSEWTRTANRTLLPEGADRSRLCIHATLPVENDQVFFDSGWAWLECVPRQ